MIPATLLHRYSVDQLLAAFEVIQNRGPYTEATRRTIQDLAALGYAKVLTRMSTGERGNVYMELVKSEMTERGADLLHELQVTTGIIDE